MLQKHCIPKDPAQNVHKMTQSIFIKLCKIVIRVVSNKSFNGYKVRKWTVFELQRIKHQTIITNLGEYCKNRRAEKEMFLTKINVLWWGHLRCHVFVLIDIFDGDNENYKFYKVWFSVPNLDLNCPLNKQVFPRKKNHKHIKYSTFKRFIIFCIIFYIIQGI